MRHGNPIPRPLDASKSVGDAAPLCVAKGSVLTPQVAEMEKEILRLREICQRAHDRLLSGDSDGELLALLEKSWTEKPANFFGPNDKDEAHAR